ncbi:hypothetical protein [Methylomonas methanica]|uniref:Secreted protein n=1 Tax=Methylomonas methanica (strain DSM 25384 / MC09) TaxID=857087 RepID=G0A7C2_METMM|nr:hypothetical protein [Methylomonas methanica]AEF99415.1 hypothetical protein Metme_0978 [Methylomonas methanica MC09]
MTTLFREFFLLTLLLFCSASIAAPVFQIDGNGILTGATGVDVGGTLFDVEFVDGDCVSLFDGCDSSDDFVFKEIGPAEEASKSLLEEVFVGVFDDDQTLTRGCETSSFFGCVIITPYKINPADSNFVFVNIANNRSNLSVDSFIGSSNLITFDTALFGDYTYARWSQVTTVPLPPAFYLWLTGLISLFAGYRPKKINKSIA